MIIKILKETNTLLLADLLPRELQLGQGINMNTTTLILFLHPILISGKISTQTWSLELIGTTTTSARSNSTKMGSKVEYFPISTKRRTEIKKEMLSQLEEKEVLQEPWNNLT